jgi:hypothetical protein
MHGRAADLADTGLQADVDATAAQQVRRSLAQFAAEFGHHRVGGIEQHPGDVRGAERQEPGSRLSVLRPICAASSVPA